MFKILFQKYFWETSWKKGWFSSFVKVFNIFLHYLNYSSEVALCVLQRQDQNFILEILVLSKNFIFDFLLHLGKCVNIFYIIWFRREKSMRKWRDDFETLNLKKNIPEFGKIFIFGFLHYLWRALSSFCIKYLISSILWRNFENIFHFWNLFKFSLFHLIVLNDSYFKTWRCLFLYFWLSF